jgi:hypothetical protein
MTKFEQESNFFYCPIFESKDDYERRMGTDLAADVFNEMYSTAASYAKYDRSIGLYAIFGIILADNIIKANDKSYKWLIDSTIIKAKDSLDNFIKECCEQLNV